MKKAGIYDELEQKLGEGGPTRTEHNESKPHRASFSTDFRC